MPRMGLSPLPGLAWRACPYPTAVAVGHPMSPAGAGSGDRGNLKLALAGGMPGARNLRASTTSLRPARKNG